MAALVDTLAAKTRVWEAEKGMPFTYDGVPLLAMLEEYMLLRHNREEEKRRLRVSINSILFYSYYKNLGFGGFVSICSFFLIFTEGKWLFIFIASPVGLLFYCYHNLKGMVSDLHCSWLTLFHHELRPWEKKKITMVSVSVVADTVYWYFFRINLIVLIMWSLTQFTDTASNLSNCANSVAGSEEISWTVDHRAGDTIWVKAQPCPATGLKES